MDWVVRINLNAKSTRNCSIIVCLKCVEIFEKIGIKVLRKWIFHVEMEFLYNWTEDCKCYYYFTIFVIIDVNCVKCWNIEKIEIEVKLEILYNYAEIVKMQKCVEIFEKIRIKFFKNGI